MTCEARGFRTDLALPSIARGPEELLPGGQLSDVVGIDGDEFRGVDTEMS